ncbi:hypothetical protein NHJ13051_002052 [Beauveria bassiana]
MLGPDDLLLGRSYYFRIPNRVGNTMTDPYPGILAARDEVGYLGARVSDDALHVGGKF